MKNIAIAGLGFVGGALLKYFEKQNINVFKYDKGKNIGSIEELNKGDYIFICVPTNYKNGKCDTSIVEDVVNKLEGSKVIIIKSTVIPGTTKTLQEKYPQHKFLFNPEFLTEVTADQDCQFPDRQLLGYTNKSFTVAEDVMLMLPLAPYEKIMPCTEAEYVKYFGNCWFAVKVAFANQMYDLTQKLGIEYDTIKEGVAADKRIGRTHLEIWHKGFKGFSGSCLPKDSKALISFAKNNNIDLSILQATNDYNDALLKSQGIPLVNVE